MKEVLFVLIALVLPGVAARAEQTQITPLISSNALSRLDEIIKSGVLHICTTGDYKPYSFVRPDGRFEGIDIELTEALAHSLGVKPEYIKTSWSNLMTDFVTKCDIAAGGISITLDRQTQVFFTRPITMDGKTPIARCEDVRKYQSIAQIDQPNTRIIVNPGGTNERFARQLFPHADLSVYPDNITIFKQILENKADIMLTDASETLLQQKLNPGLCSIHPDKPFVYGEKAYMVPRGDVILQQYIDQFLHLFKANGEYQKVADEWFK